MCTSLFSGAFAKDMDLGDPKVVCQLLDEAGCDGAALIEGAEQQAVKDALKQNNPGCTGSWRIWSTDVYSG